MNDTILDWVVDFILTAFRNIANMFSSSKKSQGNSSQNDAKKEQQTGGSRQPQKSNQDSFFQKPKLYTERFDENEKIKQSDRQRNADLSNFDDKGAQFGALGSLASKTTSKNSEYSFNRYERYTEKPNGNEELKQSGQERNADLINYGSKANQYEIAHDLLDARSSSNAENSSQKATFSTEKNPASKNQKQRICDLIASSNREVLEKYEQEKKLNNFNQTQLKQSSSEPSKNTFSMESNSKFAIPDNLPHYNILLLGETGAGKSTTINAFANYVKYKTFDQAAKAPDFVQLISSCFTLTNPKTGEDFPIYSGKDGNENHSNVGASRTQEPMAYQFVYQDKLVKIIDTPGMGDTRGMMVDKKNFDSILDYLSHYKELHAICVLIKSNEARKVASFRYCITELLSRLHRHACKNIVFCFTFSRNTFYAPGDGFVMLREFLSEELPEVDIKLRNAVNCFFVDNEAYRFLVAKKCGFPFLPQQANSFKESWDKSALQTNAMIVQMLQLKPHNLDETVDLNRASKLIMKLTQPMIQLQLNANYIHRYAANLIVNFNKSNNKMDALKTILNIEVNDLEINQLKYPVTICTASKCVKLSNRSNVHYNTRCHEHCTEIEIDNNIVGHDLLRNCTIMAGGSKCRSCGCGWKEHMQLAVEYSLVTRQLIDPANIFTQKTAKAQISMLSQMLKELESNYICELDAIQFISAIFGYMLEKFSNTSFNRSVEPYLEHLILEEKRKIQNIPKYTDLNYNALTQLKQIQSQKIDDIKRKISTGHLKPFELKDVQELCDSLVELKHSGPKISKVIEAFNLNNQKQAEHNERFGIILPN